MADHISPQIFNALCKYYGFVKCVITHIHHYGIIPCVLIALKFFCGLPGHPSFPQLVYFFMS